MKTYTAEELKDWWAARCPKCGWEGLSRDCNGGTSIADTGDFSDVLCPKCNTKVEDGECTVSDVPEKKYSIEEIKEWLNGCRMLGWVDHEKLGEVNEWNKSLNSAIHEIEDPEDGIEAVTERVKGYTK